MTSQELQTSNYIIFHVYSSQINEIMPFNHNCVLTTLCKYCPSLFKKIRMSSFSSVSFYRINLRIFSDRDKLNTEMKTL